jgi:hypothetical protein
MPPLLGLGFRFGEWTHDRALAVPRHCPGRGCFCLSKAPEGWRSPKVGAWTRHADGREASWSAAVLCRFPAWHWVELGSAPVPGRVLAVNSFVLKGHNPNSRG